LDEAVLDRDEYLLRLKVDPVFDGLRADPRYDRILTCVKAKNRLGG
jgi:hypothetical protein